MTSIWGFDLSEMHWNAFRRAKMFDRKWYLRKERFIVYKVAMLTGLVAECIATYSLSKYTFTKNDIEEASGGEVAVDRTDIYAAQVLTIVFCVLVATLFGTDFFFLVFWPQRRYPKWYHTAKKMLSVLITAGMAAATILSTFVISTREIKLSGSPSSNNTLAERFPNPPHIYRHWGQNIAWIALLWIAFLSTIASTVLLFISAKHDREHGTSPYPRGTPSSANGLSRNPSATSGTLESAGYRK